MWKRGQEMLGQETRATGLSPPCPWASCVGVSKYSDRGGQFDLDFLLFVAENTLL